jgi:acyl-CoA hydrolase
LGDTAFYAALDQHPQFYFRPASETHNVLRLAGLTNFRAINSAIEVDLFGQVNSDVVGSALVAGVGGLPAFVSGARLATRGRSIIVVPATTPNGKVSRIVPTLGSPGLAAVSRHAADFVVTENGIAALRGLSIEQRAAALIRIADPKFQEPLSAQWHELFRKCTSS